MTRGHYGNGNAATTPLSIRRVGQFTNPWNWAGAECGRLRGAAEPAVAVRQPETLSWLRSLCSGSDHGLSRIHAVTRRFQPKTAEGVQNSGPSEHLSTDCRNLHSHCLGISALRLV